MSQPKYLDGKMSLFVRAQNGTAQNIGKKTI